VPPIIPPHELPTKCTLSMARPSNRSTTQRAQSVKLNIARSGALPPWPGGSTSTVRWVSPKRAAWPVHKSPVINRLGHIRTAGPVPALT
jgi:hypothetical protein